MGGGGIIFSKLVITICSSNVSDIQPSSSRSEASARKKRGCSMNLDLGVTSQLCQSSVQREPGTRLSDTISFLKYISCIGRKE